MSEQPAFSYDPAVELPLPTPEETAALDAEIQLRAMSVLGPDVQGMPAPAPQPEATVPAPAPTPKSVFEDRKQPEPVLNPDSVLVDEHRKNPEHVAVFKAFDLAARAVTGLRSEIGFIALCDSRRIDTEKPESREYRLALAEYGIQTADGRLKAGGCPPLTLAAIKLAVKAPGFVTENREKEQLDSKKLNSSASTRYLCEFNSLIRDFADQFPDTPPSIITGSLIGIVSSLSAFTPASATEATKQAKKEFDRYSTERLRTAVNGAKHEYAYGQILDKLPYQSRPATIKEDMEGADYVVSYRNPDRELPLDVKASSYAIKEAKMEFIKGKDPTKIDIRALEEPYFIKLNGKVMVTAELSESELGDNFLITDELAAAKAVDLDLMLSQIANRIAGI
jgi:hypothetical protein